MTAAIWQDGRDSISGSIMLTAVHPTTAEGGEGRIHGDDQSVLIDAQLD